MNERLQDLLEPFPEYLGGHILVAVAALGVGLLVSIPLGILASRKPKLSEVLLGAAGILQTIPTLALLVLMVPVLGGSIGFAPAFVALVLYSILPILANTITGLRGIDPSMTEAARGLGMSDRQMLFRVQLPLAAPIIIAGIRTATVLVVGTATLATPVGGMSLGNYIFSGLEMNDFAAMIFGCVVTALLAIAMDQLIHLYELALERRSRRLACYATAGLAVIVLGGLYTPVAQAFTRPAEPPIVVANAPFTEQYILSEVMKELLEKGGLTVDQRKGMGETIQFLALKQNKIDCCINYTGNIWATLMRRDDIPDATTIYNETKAYLAEKHGIRCLGKIGFENAYVLAVRDGDQRMKNVNRIGDLKDMAPRLKIIGDRQFFARPEWRQVHEKYGLTFRDKVSMDPNFLYETIAEEKADVICAYSSDGRIKHKKLRKLQDTEGVLPRYEAVLLLSPLAASDPRIVAALTPLLGKVDDETMRETNYLVDGKGQRPRDAARKILARL